MHHMTRMRAVLALWLAGAALAAAAQQVSGTVRSSQAPLPGALVQAEVDGTRRSAGTTGADGSFSFDLRTVFGRNIAPTSDLLVHVSLAGFTPEARLSRVAEASAQPLQIVLRPSGGGSVLSQAERDKLAAFVTVGRTGPLMLVPYDLPAMPGDPNLNERLRSNIERLIVTYVQSVLGSGSGDLALRLLPVEGQRDIAKLRDLGQHVNALAIVSGSGERAAGSDTFMVTSTYVIIPQTTSFQPPTVFVDDQIPADKLGRTELHKQLSRLWGRVTVLAMAVRDYNAAPAGPPPARKEALKRIRDYLTDERAGAGPGNTQFLAEINTLIAQIDQEVKP